MVLAVDLEVDCELDEKMDVRVDSAGVVGGIVVSVFPGGAELGTDVVGFWPVTGGVTVIVVVVVGGTRVIIDISGNSSAFRARFA